MRYFQRYVGIQSLGFLYFSQILLLSLILHILMFFYASSLNFFKLFTQFLHGFCFLPCVYLAINFYKRFHTDNCSAVYMDYVFCAINNYVMQPDRVLRSLLDNSKMSIEVESSRVLVFKRVNNKYVHKSPAYNKVGRHGTKNQVLRMATSLSYSSLSSTSLSYTSSSNTSLTYI